MSDIGSCITDIAVHLAHNTDVLVAVEERIFLVALAWSATSVRRLVGLETGIGEDNDEAFAAFVAGWNGDMLFSDELRELGRGERLGS